MKTLWALLVILLCTSAYGQQWSAPVNISNTAEAGTFSLYPVVSIDKSGVSHVTYVDGLDNPKGWELWYTSNAGGLWSARRNIGYPVPDCRDQKHGWKPNGDLVVGFGGYPNGYGRGVAETYMVEKVNGVWQSPLMVSPDDAQHSFGGTAFEVDPDGGVHAGWLTNDPMYRCRKPDGAWTTPSTVANAVNPNGTTALCATGSGANQKVHFFYGDRLIPSFDANKVYYCRYNGASWTSPVAISTTSAYAGNPYVMTDGANKIYLFWVGETSAGSGLMHIFFSQSNDCGLTWSAPVDIVGGTIERAVNPKGCFDSFGNLHLVYEQRVTSNTYDLDVIYRKLTTTGWSGPQNLSNSPGTNSSSPSISCRGNMFSAVWQEDGTASGNFDIMYSSTKLAPSPVRDLRLLLENNKATVSWTNSDDPELSGVVLVYRSDRMPSSPADGTVLLDRSALKGAQESFQHTGLSSSIDYFYAVFSYNGTSPRNYSSGSMVSTCGNDVKCNAVKSLDDGSPVSVSGKIVTAVLSGKNCWYVEDPDKTSAMRIWGQTTRVAGDRVNVSGTIGVATVNGKTSEREIKSPVVTFLAHGDPLEPVGMQAKWTGGSSLNAATPGVVNGIGPNNMGLFIRVWGKVVGTGSGFFMIDEGSGIVYRDGRQGLRIQASTYTVKLGDYVMAQGIVQGQIPSGTSLNEPIVQTRSSTDIVKLR